MGSGTQDKDLRLPGTPGDRESVHVPSPRFSPSWPSSSVPPSVSVMLSNHVPGHLLSPSRDVLS